jgi:hypothetical protein
MITSLPNKIFKLKNCCLENYSYGRGRANICCATHAPFVCAAAIVVRLAYRKRITKSHGWQYRAVVIRLLNVPGTQFPHHSWCHSWNTCHVKLLAPDLFTIVHHFVYFVFQWNAVTGLSSKLHLSDTCLWSYQLPIPVNTSAIFVFWICHFRIFAPLSLLLKPSA